MREVQPRNILCVLAGGRSSRFGSSKLWVRLDGEPILAWQVRRLVGAVGKVIPGRAESWLNLAPNVRLPPGAGAFDRRVSDRVAHAGPTEGMAAAADLAHPHDLIAFVPADMPAIAADDLARLAARLKEEPDAIGVMSQWIDGPAKLRIEPLPSIWRVGPARVVLENAARKALGPSQLTETGRVARMELTTQRDADAWASINRPEDLDAFAKRLGVTLTPDSPE